MEKAQAVEIVKAKIKGEWNDVDSRRAKAMAALEEEKFP